MVDLHQQYLLFKEEIDSAVLECLDSSLFIKGPVVKNFEKELSDYLKIREVISCGNGTDALQIALMSLNLPRGSKIIVPAFTYVAPVEVLTFLGYIPVFADIDTNSFNITIEEIEKVYCDGVKAIIVVHLFGQPCEMVAIDSFAKKNNLYLIEDNAQSIGAEKNIGRNSIMTTSFFPSKNLGAYGDGGALMTNDEDLAQKIRLIANHGQRERYFHEEIGINSRLDAIQAAILSVKLKYLDEFISMRQKSAAIYDACLKNIPQIHTPSHSTSTNHTFHQYTLRIDSKHRNGLQRFLQERHIATAIYYPIPCYQQKAYIQKNIFLPNTELMCNSVLSLPIYPEITKDQLLYICSTIKEYFNKTSS